MRQDWQIALILFAMMAVLAPEGMALCGDVDNSGIVGTPDVVALTNYLFLDGTLQDTSAADVNDCGEIDPSDLWYLIWAHYGTGPDPCQAPGVCEHDAANFRLYVDYPGEVVLPQGGGTFEVPVHLAFDEPLLGFSLGFHYSAVSCAIDTAYAAEEFPGYFFLEHQAEENLFVVCNYAHDPYEPDSGLMFTLIFEVAPFTEQLTLELDTVGWSPKVPSIVSPAWRGSVHPYFSELGELTVTPCFYGDADGDGLANITDAVFVISYIFSGGDPPDPYLAGDANCDELVNVTDAVYIISYIFNDGPAPGEDC